MNTRLGLGLVIGASFGLAGLTIGSDFLETNNGVGSEGAIGPDVTTHRIAESGGFDMHYYGTSSGLTGWAIATQSCNEGDRVANWYSGTNEVPVIASNCFRYKDGRFEQIGLNWLKHSFCAVSEPGCGSCQSTNCDTLGIGCADTYWATLNGDAIVPRVDINPHTGYYDYPFSDAPTGPTTLRGKMQIDLDDINPSSNAGARYAIEAQYVTEDDAAWRNQMNNASWREVSFDSGGTDADPEGDTQKHWPAIVAWELWDSNAAVEFVDAPGDGRFFVGRAVTDNGDGTWHYEFAIHNLNYHGAIRSFSIDIAECVSVSNVGFKDIDYHSGSVIDGTDWVSSRSNISLRWGSTQTYAQNVNANALRWGSLYNFWFDADAPPVEGQMWTETFRPEGEPVVLFDGIKIDPDCGDECVGDVTGDDFVNVSDLLFIIDQWGQSGSDADADGDGTVGVGDLLIVLDAWGAC
jgi:hypothetical protein